jgi:deazaflavin-dependent oxidoreductase (nitroreductase family)
MAAVVSPPVREPAPTHDHLREAVTEPPRSPRRTAPGPSRLSTASRARLRAAFRVFNRLMAPALRAGLGPWLGSPLGSWLLLLRTRGRMSGQWRDVPLSYLISDGSVWVMSGMGAGSHWLRNIEADPLVEVILPGRSLRCVATLADDATRRRVLPALVRVVGLPGYLGGVDPYFGSDERNLAALGSVPLIRLQPLDGMLAAGPDDPGGLGWLWRQPLALLATAILTIRLRRLWRRRRSP